MLFGWLVGFFFPFFHWEKKKQIDFDVTLLIFLMEEDIFQQSNSRSLKIV